jgi:hypothetical protein
VPERGRGQARCGVAAATSSTLENHEWQRQGQLSQPAKQAAVLNVLVQRPFALQDVVQLDASGKRGGLLYRLGHEVRSLHHPGYLRPLYNRRE